MKQSVLLLLTIITMVSPLSAIEYVKTIDFDRDSFSLKTDSINGDTYTVIEYGDMISNANPGAPSLPHKYITLALPPYASDIQVALIGQNISEFNRISYPIIPASSPMKNGYDDNISCTMDSVIYGSKQQYPNSNVRVVCAEDHFGKNTMVTIALIPLQYTPTTGDLTVYDNMTFKLSYNINIFNTNTLQDDNYTWTKMSLKEREWAYDIISRKVLNPEDINENDYIQPYTTPFSSILNDKVGGIQIYEYSIITTRELKEAFERLASLKRQLGIDAGVICIEDILSNPLVQNGDTISNLNDDAGKLRHFIRLGARNANLKYCLLGGKHPAIPIRYGTPINYNQDKKNYNDIPDSEHVPTDWYFAEFNRNWNVDGDVFLGEFIEEKSEQGIDRLYRANIYLGRLPCLTVNEVNNYIDKLEIYLTNPGLGDTSYLDAAHSHFSRSSVRSGTTTELVLSANNKIDYSYNTHDIYRQYEYVTGAFVLSSIIKKKYGFMDFHGHANPFSLQVADSSSSGSSPISVVDALDEWHKYGPIEYNNGLDKLDNFGYPNIMYVNSCNTAPTDAPNYCGYGTLFNYSDVPMTLAESFLLGKNYGGVAYIGNTRDGYAGYSSQLEASFFDNFWRGGVYAEIGRLFNQSNWETNSSRDGLDYIKRTGYYVRLSRNLFGDPQLMIWRGIPTRLTDFRVNRGSDNLQVEWNGDYNGNIGCECVAVEPNGKVHRQGFSSNLVNFFDVSPNSVVTIIKDNMIPYICDLSLQNILFNSDMYTYCKSATIGKSVRKYSQGDVVFDTGCNYTLDATDDVELKHGTIVRNGAVLRIYTPGTCSIDSICVEPGGILEIHAAKLVNYLSDIDIRNDGRFKTSGYDKYGLGNESPIQIHNVKPQLKSRRESSNYLPMLENGKEWRYTLHDCSVFSDNPEPDLKRVYRIDGMKNIGGKDYYVMNTYTSNADTPDGNTPYGYFREDVAEKKVYFLDNFDYDASPMYTELLEKRWNAKEYLLYDFEEGAPACVAADLHVCGNTYNGFRYVSATTDDTLPVYGFFEGLGLVGYPDIQDGAMGCGMFDILGFCLVPMGGESRYFPFLYEIATKDGTVYYRNEYNCPASIDATKINSRINKTSEYYTLQGIKMSNKPAAPGIYLRREGNKAIKVVIR